MKIAILGSGNMAGYVIRHLMDDDVVQDITAYDINKERLISVKQKYNVHTTNTLDVILSNPQIPLVFVTAANDAHKSLTLQALDARKAVMCEKPMATSLSDALEMVEAAERNKGFLQIGFELRYSKMYVKVKEWIDAGLLGHVHNTNCSYIVSECWRNKAWRCKKHLSGGMFGEKLSHYVDLPRWWIGSKVTDVHSVCAPNTISYFEVRDNYHTTYRFENGAVSHLTFMMGPASSESADVDPFQQDYSALKSGGHDLRYLVVGTKGVAETNVFDQSIKRWEFGSTSDGLTSTLAEQLTWEPSRDQNMAYTHNTGDQAKDIVRRVANGQPPTISPRDAYETTKLCFAAEESADTGSTINLNSFEECRQGVKADRV